jgi:PAS domain S-box-containing protein
MTDGPLPRKVDPAYERLKRLSRRVEELPPPHRDFANEVLEAFSAAVEELHQQNQELLAAREEAEAQRRRYRNLFEFAPDGYLITDPAGIIQDANEAAVDLLHVPKLELLGKPLVHYVAPGERNRFHRHLGRLVERHGMEARQAEWEMRVQPRRGPTFPAALTVGPVRNVQGALTGLRWLLRDVTASKRAEERERLLNDVQQLAVSLERERELQQTIMENTSAHLAYLDPAFNFVRVNAAYARGSGHSREELIGRNHFALFPDAENQTIFERVRDTGEPVAFNARAFEYPDQPQRGTTYWDWALVPVKDEGGVVQGLVLSATDVTEQKEAQRALALYADRLHVLHEADQVILSAGSVDEIVAAVLPLTRELVPCRRASVLAFDPEAGEAVVLGVQAGGETRWGKGARLPLDEKWPPEELAAGEMSLVEDLSAAESTPLLKDLRAEGVQSFVSVPLLIQGELLGTLNLGLEEPGGISPEGCEILRQMADQLAIGLRQARLHQEIQHYTERLEESVARRTAALRVSEARFRAIFERAGLGIALLDRQGRITTGNPALRAILGYPGEELRGKKLAGFTHPDDDPSTEEALHEALMAGERETYRLEKRYVCNDDEVIWANLTVSLVRSAQSEPRFAVALVEDITERKRAQKALAQSEKLALAGRLAASLAHEINNPLQSVIGCLGLAEETLPQGEENLYLQIAREELHRTRQIVDQLRDLARPAQPPDKVPADVHELLARVLILGEKQYPDREIEVVWQEDRDLPPVPMAADQIQQVFLNLVLNAFDAMPEGGRLTLNVAPTSDPAGVCIRFRDTGVGIAPDLLPHVFDPFYSTKTEGLGLGLFVSQNIVSEHEGWIEVESELGEGSTFTVWLPLDR